MCSGYNSNPCIYEVETGVLEIKGQLHCMRIFKNYHQLLNDNNNISDRNVKFLTQRVCTQTHTIVLSYEHLPFTFLVYAYAFVYN